MGEPYIAREEGRHQNSFYYHVGDGLYYHFNGENTSTIFFRCRVSSCSGRALLRLNEGFRHTVPHNHSPDVLFSQINNARRNIIERATSLTYMSFSDILASERRRIPDRMVRSQLTMRRLRPAMQRARAMMFPNILSSLAILSATLEDPAWLHLTITLDSVCSIYLGSARATDGSHNIVFCSARCLEVMREVNLLFADGTFFITPSIDNCYQVFTIVTVVSHTVSTIFCLLPLLCYVKLSSFTFILLHIVPLCWCLMESKSEAAYISVLLLLRVHLVHFNFTKVITDYEDAIINAFSIVFGVEVQGCFFHSASAMARHARVTIGVLLISQHEEIMNVVRLCCALPLLPQNLLQLGLNAIGTEALNLNDQFIYGIVRPFLMYVQNYWLNHVNRGQCLSVCLSEHRTNNASESNNRDMKRQFGVHHPNVYQFIRKLVEFEDDVVDDLFSLSTGFIPTRHRPVAAVSCDVRIQALTRNLLTIVNPSHQQIMQFLISASQSVNRIVHEILDIPMPPT